MLTYDDCLGLCDLTEEEIDAIASHEQLPQILAVELGNYLIHCSDGETRIKKIIIDDIEQAMQQGHQARVVQLKMVLKHFVETHPAAKTT